MNRRYKIADWYIRPDLLEISRGSFSISLTEAEMDLLRLLLSRAPEPLSLAFLQNNSPQWKQRRIDDLQDTLNRLQISLAGEEGTLLWNLLPDSRVALCAPVEILPTASPSQQPKWLQETPSTPSPQPSAKGPLLALAFTLTLALGLVMAPLIFTRDMESPWESVAVDPADTPGHSSLSPDHQYLAFTWPRKNSSSNLYVKDLATNRVLQLTQSAGKDLSPVWAPDGSQLAFIRQSDAENSLQLFSVNTFEESTLLSLSKNPGAGLSWSPDGQLLAFSDSLSLTQSPAIMALELNTRRIQQLSFPNGEDSQDVLPRFSPSGKHLAFFRRKANGPATLMVRHESETEPQALFTEGGSPVDLRWLSDSQILYAIESNHGFDYRRMDLTTMVNQPAMGWDHAGSWPAFQSNTSPSPPKNSDIFILPLPAPQDSPHATPRALFASSQDETSPSYSPDGARLAFATQNAEGSQLWISDLKSLQTQPLMTPGLTWLDQPRWSPDGKALAFHGKTHRFGPTQIFLMTLKNGNLQKISPDNQEESQPRWSADGSSLYIVVGNQRLLVRRHLATGKSESLGITGVLCAAENTQGTQVLFTFRGNDTTLWQTDLEGTALTPVFTSSAFQTSNWSVTVDGIYYITNQPTGASVYLHRWNSSQSVLVQTLPFRPLPHGFTVARNGQNLALAKATPLSSEGLPLPMR